MRMSFLPRGMFVAGCSAALLFAQAAGSSADPAIQIAVKNWSFTPAAVDAKVGVPTVLDFKSSEGVHGVESKEIGLASTTIMPGKVSEATFTPKTAGTFTLHCTIVCGEGHDKMAMIVKVAP